MTLRAIVIFGVILSGVSCQNDIVVGDLPQVVIDQIIAILTGTLTLTGQCAPPQVQNVSFLLYTRSYPNNPVTLNENNLAEVDPEKKLVLVIHGWMSSATAVGIPELKDAYLQRYDCNLIIVDWSQLAAQLYTTSYCQLPGVAQLVANFLCSLGIPLGTVHLVGHSLGGQMSGFIGTFTKATCAQQIGRITGLDPAGPLYQGTSNGKRLDASDAIFVDVIHTNALQFGYWGNCGDVDFYPNCGSYQNGCERVDITNITNTLISVVRCSHFRAMYYMAESANSDNFKAVSCSNCQLSCSGDMLNPLYIIMGENCPANPTKKVFTLPTNSSSLFARGCLPYSAGCS